MYRLDYYKLKILILQQCKKFKFLLNYIFPKCPYKQRQRYHSGVQSAPRNLFQNDENQFYQQSKTVFKISVKQPILQVAYIKCAY